MLAWDESGLLWHYMSDRLGIEKDTKGVGFIAFHEGKMVGAFGITPFFSSEANRQIIIDCVSESPAWVTRQAVKDIYEMIFASPPHGMGIHRINSFVAKSNRKSLALTKRLGFKREGILREAGPDREDLVGFSLLSTDAVPFLKHTDDRRPSSAKNQAEQTPDAQTPEQTPDAQTPDVAEI